jgi:hypothetical protein
MPRFPLPGVVRFVATAALGLLVFPIPQEFVVKLAEENGLFDQPSARLGAAMTFISSITDAAWYPWVVGPLGGLVAGLWLDHLMRKRTKAVAPSEALKEQVKPPDPVSTALEVVANRVFKNETVRLDRIRFINCEFSDVLVTWDGGPYQFDNCKIDAGGGQWVWNEQPSGQGVLASDGHAWGGSPQTRFRTGASHCE